ncbi:hypothetical protein MicvaDRAFT_0682 [Microcoleus vaginatus FGP-2]|nr:hypothetical protein MicvaDRAFT_0682 [Microcoleus vaginatus FGP-2]
MIYLMLGCGAFVAQENPPLVWSLTEPEPEPKIMFYYPKIETAAGN